MECDKYFQLFLFPPLLLYATEFFESFSLINNYKLDFLLLIIFNNYE